jgi:hypothetical protein
VNKLIKPDREPDFVFTQLATHYFWFKEKVELYVFNIDKLFEIKILKNKILWLDENSTLWMGYVFNNELMVAYKKWLINKSLKKKLGEK